MKHGCGTRGATPTFDAAGRGDARGMPLPACLAESCRVVPCGFHFFFSRLASTGVNMAPTRADSRGLIAKRSAEGNEDSEDPGLRTKAWVAPYKHSFHLPDLRDCLEPNAPRNESATATSRPSGALAPSLRRKTLR